jgi:RHS repeat-associated protein
MLPLSFDGRDIDELGVAHEVDVDAHTGAAVLRVPVPAPPGRGGLGPSFVLTHSSQAGNSPFGFGWSLAGLPTISIDTRKHLPRWDGSDDYQLGQDSLTPWLEPVSGAWRPRGFDDGAFAVTFYRSRAGGSTVRVEKWVERTTGRVHFRTRDPRDVLTVYGARPGAEARVADPDDEARTYLWLPEVQIDPHGNAVWIEYAAENLSGVDRTLPAEFRPPALAQRYLERVRYGNVRPLELTPEVLAGQRPGGLSWCYQLVFDYGDHGGTQRPVADPDRAWPARPDAFSSCRAGFEVRTYRLCRRILSFHDFPELGAGPTLVGALTLTHDEDPSGSTILEIAYTGFRNDGSARTLPPLRMTYTPAATGGGFEPAPAEAQENVPAGLAGQRCVFIDLFGEGLPGILAEGEHASWYKPNLGAGRFGAQVVISERPATRPGAYTYGDHDRDGDTDLSQMAGRLAGFFELDRQQGRWQGFRPFATLPHVEALGGRAQWVDLNGDGRPDVVVAKADHLVWFPSEGDGFGDPIEIARPDGRGAVPLIGEDPALDFFFADMNGDGLVDIVRAGNGRVEYWPNLGNGRFGAGVLMDGSPLFASDDEFDASRLRFVDLDGSGTADLVYIGHGDVTCWINASGNQLVPGPRPGGLPYLDQVSTARILEFLGDGRPCLVWSSPLPGRDAPIQYLPLVSADQPRLLCALDNGLGQETRLAYSSSAAHYFRDQRAGRPWAIRLPTHVTVVDRLEVFDHVGATQSVTRYEYREGHFDGEDREFRGFGQVDVYDAQETAAAGPAAETFAAPALTRTWFHLGTPLWGEHQLGEIYSGGPPLPRVTSYALECDEVLAEGEAAEAVRALTGRILRREVYAIDEQGRRGADPFEVMQAGYRVVRSQPVRAGAPAAWSVIPAEELVAVYEQEAGDPRLVHRITVETDIYGQVVRQADVAYARRAGRPRDVAVQGESNLLVHDFRLVNIDEPCRFELGVPVEGKDYELFGVAPRDGTLVTRDRLRGADVVAALAVPHPHHEEPPPGLAARLLSWERSFYWDDSRTAPLALGSLGSLTLVHHEESACFTPGLAADVYAARADAGRLAALGYALHDGYYWKRDETHHFAPADRFSQRIAVEARDGGRTTYTYDSYALEITAVEDPLGNRTTAELDYHVLSPWRVTDPNGTVLEARYDPLGVIVAETSRGSVAGNVWGFDALAAVALRTPAGLADVFADPAHYLQGAARFTAYDLESWRRDGTPTGVVTLAREELRNDGRGGGRADGRIQVQVSYFDGLGRLLQTKTFVEPGPAIQRGPDGAVVLDAAGRPVLGQAAERWLTSGHVVQDAKQRPSRVYEPFFSTTWRYEGDEVLRRFGVSSSTRYDVLGRVVAEHLPNGTFTRVTYGPWAITREDANDTVLESVYRVMREGLPADDPERQAFEHARTHAGTPTTTFLDPRGREVGSLARGGATADDRRTEVCLDGAGEVREVLDPRGLVAFRYRRDMEGRLLATHSVDAGDTWALLDGDDRLVFTWDGRGVEVEHTYDRLDRITAVHVRGAGLDHRVEERVYGETVADAAARNLLGRLVTVRDQAGETTVDRCDPSGQPLRATRRLRADLDEPDWRTPVTLGLDTFVSETWFDAFGRPLREVLPDGTARATDYLRGGGGNRIRLTTPDGRLLDTPVLDGAEFDARGQRMRVRLGNGVEVAYGYDPETTRLATQTTRRGPRTFQNIRYTYDPVGNLVRLEDAAHEPGPGSLITGTTIGARRDYAYDAHYRLGRATGRVHQALLEHDYIPGVGPIKGTRHLSLDNGAALERFTQTYAYDASGNLQRIRHAGTTQSWTTEMWVSPTSNRSLPRLDPGGVPLPDPESHFDAAGNLARMAHLRRIDWSWRGTLNRAVVIERPGGTDDGESYTYGADGMRARKVATRVVHGGEVEVTEKVYFGTSERKRVLRGGAVILERWTTHVSDGEGRVALVHRWVTDLLRRETDDPSRPRVVYQLTTHQGSSAVEVDEDGNLVSYEEYFPYGGTAFIAGDRARDIDLKEYRYTGKERDDATNLYYFGYRYYAPWMGRWLSPDPLGPEDDLNLYQFVLGDPVGNVDEDGLQTSDRLRHRGLREAPADLPRTPLPPGYFWIEVVDPLHRTHQWIQVPERVALELGGREYYTPVRRRTRRPGRRTGGGGRTPGRRPRRAPSTEGATAGTEPRNVAAGSGDQGGTGTGGTGQAPGANGSSADSNGRGTRGDTGSTSTEVTGDQTPGTGGTGGTQGNGGNEGTSSRRGSTGTDATRGTGGVGAGDSDGKGQGPGQGEVGRGIGASGFDGMGEEEDGSDPGEGRGTELEEEEGEGRGVGNGPGDGAGQQGTGPGVGDGHPSGTKPRGSQYGSLRGMEGGAPGGKGRERGGQLGGTGTKTGGNLDPNLAPSPTGQPAPPGLQSNGTDVNGTLDGTPTGTRGGTGGMPGGDPRASRQGTHAEGTRDGSPRGRSDGWTAGTLTGPESIGDKLRNWAGMANLEFAGGGPKGQRGGIPGGRGRRNLGWFGPAAYVALTLIAWMGAGIRAVGSLLRRAVRAVLRGIRGGVARLRGAVLRASRRFSPSGVPRFDERMVGTARYAKWKSRMEQRGYEVRETPLPEGNPAQIRKRTITVDPEQFTYKDILHESRHVQQEKLAAALGLPAPAATWFTRFCEQAAYKYELNLGERYAFSPAYMRELSEMFDLYRPYNWVKKLLLSPTRQAWVDKLTAFKVFKVF